MNLLNDLINETFYGEQNQRLTHQTQIISKMNRLSGQLDNYTLEELEELNHRLDILTSSFANVG